MYADTLRDRVTVQQAVLTDDNGGGQTHTWSAVFSWKCRAVQLDGRMLVDVYKRETNEEGYRFFGEDRIVTTDGETSFHRLLRKAGKERFLLLWQGDRTLAVMGMRKPAAGTSDHFAENFWVDAIETPEGVGYYDD
jgi:hypothetical protein